MLSGNQLAHTYSIVARDPQSGDMGVAVQSHWFSVGSVVTWAEAGVGAIATQSLVEVSFGPRGLELLKQGHSASEAVKNLIESDAGEKVRQLAIVDAQGNVATHTGSGCIPEAGHIIGDQFSVQANMMLNDTVWSAMADAYQQNGNLPLPERLVAALEAAEQVGGDVRGRQSAAILVVRGESTGKVWEDRLLELRIEDHPEPIKEIKRLVQVFRAYEYMNKGDEALESEDTDGALKAYSAAEALFPANLEMKFWHAISLANIGQVDKALPMFRHIFRQDKNWLILAKRLPDKGFLLVNDDDLEQIFSAGD